MRRAFKRRVAPLTPEQEAFYAGFKTQVINPQPPIKEGDFLLITDPKHPESGSVVEYMRVEWVSGMGQYGARCKLVRLDALGGSELFVWKGGARRATPGEIRLARGW